MQRVVNVRETSVVISLSSLKDAILTAFDKGMQWDGSAEIDEYSMEKIADEIMDVIIAGLQ